MTEKNEIDRKGSLDLMTVERLRTIKREREAWIRRMTGLSPQNGTAVIRLIGPVRGYEVELTKPTAAEAVIRSEERVRRVSVDRAERIAAALGVEPSVLFHVPHFRALAAYAGSTQTD